MKARIETAPPLIAGQGVVERFGGVHALRGVDFDLNQGEIHMRFRRDNEIALRVMTIVPLRVHRADNAYGA
jgi:hypothetical protein